MVADRDLEIDVLKEIGEVAEFDARYYEQTAGAWITGRFILAESPR